MGKKKGERKIIIKEKGVMNRVGCGLSVKQSSSLFPRTAHKLKKELETGRLHRWVCIPYSQREVESKQGTTKEESQRKEEKLEKRERER
jgi:hypothetical protein